MLNGRVALVTGGSRGIGRSIGIALAEAGADVAVNYRTAKDEAQSACREIESIGRRAISVGADVSKATEVGRLVANVTDQLGPIGILVNNAGVAQRRTVDELTEEDFDFALAVNLKSMFLVSQALIPAMKAAKWGRIISISSTAAHTGGVVGPHYAASKAGMIGLTHAYARDLARHGITANVIAPARAYPNMVARRPDESPASIPVQRFGDVTEVARVAVMMAGNGYMTGQTVSVNGGVYMT